jgi:hypothetical protein
LAIWKPIQRLARENRANRKPSTRPSALQIAREQIDITTIHRANIRAFVIAISY